MAQKITKFIYNKRVYFVIILALILVVTVAVAIAFNTTKSKSLNSTSKPNIIENTK